MNAVLKGLAIGAVATGSLFQSALAITRVHFVEYSDRVEMNVTGTFNTSGLVPLLNQTADGPAGTNPDSGNLRSVDIEASDIFTAYDSTSLGAPNWGGGSTSF